ncbi:hypothetical protein [Methylophilus sp. 5]|uniref:hypothetical protein n=1 Tax=Methylophilus sp. 5 TaxID=1112274 RepID=UPI000490A570|nr:hypothetical protein [Methylophilus sp. 5]
MQRTKSYMLPKLIFLNMLALMMITFEHQAPADNNPLLSAVQSGEAMAAKPDATLAAVASDSQPPAVKVAAADEEKPVTMKKPAVYKKHVPQKHSASRPHAIMLKANYTANTPLGCCFRGNRI